MTRDVKQEKKEEYQDASKSIRNYVIVSILLKNPGRFNVIPAMGDGVILDSDLSHKEVKLPKHCRIEIDTTDEYRGSTIGTIYRKDKRVAAFWGKLKRYMSVREAKELIEKLIELNNGQFNVEKSQKRFIIDTDMFLSDIKFPEGFSYRIVYYPSEEDNTYQCQIVGNDNVVFPGIINCKAKKTDKVVFPGILSEDDTLSDTIQSKGTASKK